MAVARGGRGRVPRATRTRRTWRPRAVAEVTEEPRVRMAWNGDTIVRHQPRVSELSNGAREASGALVADCRRRLPASARRATTFAERLWSTGHRDLNVCSQQGPVRALRLHHRRGARCSCPSAARDAADACAGHGGEAARVDGETTTCQRHGLGLQPLPHRAQSPYRGAYVAVVESVAKLVAAGFDTRGHVPYVPGVFRAACATSPTRWGKPGRGRARRFRWRRSTWAWQPSAARTPCPARFEQPRRAAHAGVIRHGRWVRSTASTSPEFKQAGSRIVRIAPAAYDGVVPEAAGLLEAIALVEHLIDDGTALAVSTPGYGERGARRCSRCVWATASA